MKHLITLIVMTILAAVLAGCADLIVSSVTPAQAAQMSDAQLCVDYGVKNTDILKAELVKRHAITSDDWAAIQAGVVIIGESELAVQCTFPVAYEVQTVNDPNGVTVIDTYQVAGLFTDDYTVVSVHNGVVVNVSRYTAPAN